MKSQLDTLHSRRADGLTTAWRLGIRKVVQSVGLALMLSGLFLPDLKAQSLVTIDGNPSDWYNALTSSNVHKKLPDAIAAPDDVWATGSKDYMDINTWMWKFGSVNDKGNITNAGFYVVDEPDGRHIYFFADRYAHNGDESIGFWFLQSPISLNADGTFNGLHTDGDILVISHFENGGVKISHPSVWRWDATLGTIVEIQLQPQDLDAAVNTVPVNVPDLPDDSWHYTSKEGTVDVYPINSFWEGVINLNAAGIGNISPCLSTLVIETRNSQSYNAELGDLILGQFGITPKVLPLTTTPACLGSPDAGKITLTNPESDVSYMLWKVGTPDVAITPAKEGPGTITWSALSAGFYYAIATQKTTDCETKLDTVEVVINPAPPCSITGPASVDEDGSGTYSVAGGMGYTFVWTVAPMTGVTIASPNAASTEITFKTPGNYTVSVTITSGAGCISSCTKAVEVQDRPEAFTITGSQYCASDPAKGSVTITASEVGMTYKLYNVVGDTYIAPDKPGDGGAQIWTGLNAGTYYVNAVSADAIVTRSTNDATVTMNANPVATAVATPANCFGTATGSIDLTVTGGTPTYTYLWSNGATTEDISGLIKGTYSVTVTDANNCTATAEATVDEPLALTCTAVQVSPVKCFGESNGSATVTPVGGNGGYTYLWDNGETTATAVALNAGSHSVTVTDSKGCTTTCSVTITEPPVLTCNVTGLIEVCNASMNEYTGTAGMKTYEWTITGNGTIYGPNNGQTVQVVSGTAGTYTLSLKVTNSNDCVANCSITVTVITCVPICTYTQGYYGNPGGMSCFDEPPLNTTQQALLMAIRKPDPLNPSAPAGTATFGIYASGRYFRLFESDINSNPVIKDNNIFRMLPGGGKAAAIMQYTGNGMVTFSNPMSWSVVPLDNKKNGTANTAGKIRNGLLAQTMTLYFSLQNSSVLAGVEIKAKGFITQQVDCATGIAQGDPQTFMLPESVVMFLNSNDALGAGGADKYGNTVMDLYKLANDYLGGLTPGGLSPEAVAGAVDVINNAFDECRIISGYVDPLQMAATITRTAVEQPAVNANLTQVKGLSVSTYPNPFVDRVKFVIRSEVSGQAQMEIVDMQGRVVARPYNGYIYGGRSQTVEVMLRNVTSESLIYRLRVGNNLATGKLMRVSE